MLCNENRAVGVGCRMELACGVLMNVVVQALISNAECRYGHAGIELLSVIGHDPLFNELGKTDGKHLRVNSEVTFAFKSCNNSFRNSPYTHLQGVPVVDQFQNMFAGSFLLVPRGNPSDSGDFCGILNEEVE